MVDSVTAPTTQLAPLKDTSGSKAQKSQIGLGNDFGDFLKMLTVQLQNQDPTAPLDANEFTQQIVSFSQVEQAINTNSNLESLISMQQTSQLSNAASYIGQIIEADGSSAELFQGKAEFSYSLDKQAAQTLLSISDATGRVVYSASGETTAGKHNFTWNGTASDGNDLPDGTYKITVTALDIKGNEVGSSTSTTGVVTGVVIENGTPVLEVGNAKIGLDKVLSVKAQTTG